MRETLTGYFVPGRVDMGSGLLEIFVVVSLCRRVVEMASLIDQPILAHTDPSWAHMGPYGSIGVSPAIY